MNERGVLMFAHNNEIYDYGKMALASAMTARAHLPGVPICLVTDPDTWADLIAKHPVAEEVFSQQIMVDPGSGQQRTFKSFDSSVKATYLNTSRMRALEISPFEETLLIDTDVLVFDDSLHQVWGSHADMRMNCDIGRLLRMESRDPHRERTEVRSIKTYWATIVYFRKTPAVEKFFKIAEYVLEHYHYYGVLYQYPTGIVRVDYIFSVANHIMSGYLEGEYEFAQPLPASQTFFSWNKDDLVSVDRDVATFINRDWTPFPVKVRNTVHAMNKASLLEQADRIIEIYG